MSRRIVISINTAWNIANFRAGLLRALMAEGFEVVAAAPPDAHAARLVDMGCRFVPMPMDNKGTNPAKDAGLFLRYRRLLADIRPDVFLGYTIKPNVYGSLAAQMLGIPTINNVSGLGTAFIRDTWLTKVVKHLYRTAFSRSDCVFFQNEDDRSLFLEAGLVPAGRTGVLPGSGIDVSHFQPTALPAAEVTDTVRFLLIARLLYDKGVGEYVEAARRLRAQGLDVRCALLGFLDAENRTAVPAEQIRTWVAEGIVDYLGAADDVRPHIASADCVVLPSYREGTPRTLLEGAAMARPLVTSDVPGCREVVEDGVNGLLCAPRDAEDLSTKMKAVVEMPPAARKIMGLAGRLKVERQFDEHIVVRQYLDAIERALGARGKSFGQSR